MRDDQLITGLAKIQARMTALQKASEATKERWLDANAPFAIGDILVGSLHSRYWQETGEFIVVNLGVRITDHKVWIDDEPLPSHAGHYEANTPIPELLVTVHQLTKKGTPHGNKDPFVVTMIKRDGAWIPGTWNYGIKDKWHQFDSYYTVKKP